MNTPVESPAQTVKDRSTIYGPDQSLSQCNRSVPLEVLTPDDDLITPECAFRPILQSGHDDEDGNTLNILFY